MKQQFMVERLKNGMDMKVTATHVGGMRSREWTGNHGKRQSRPGVRATARANG